MPPPEQPAAARARITTAIERQECCTAVMRNQEGYEAEMKDRLKASELLS
jgi:hypothetical protein